MHIEDIRAQYKKYYVANYSVDGNVHTWMWCGGLRYSHTEHLGTYNNPGMGTGRTSYVRSVCYRTWHRDQYRINSQGVAVDYGWRRWEERASCG